MAEKRYQFQRQFVKTEIAQSRSAVRYIKTAVRYKNLSRAPVWRNNDTAALPSEAASGSRVEISLVGTKANFMNAMRVRGICFFAGLAAVAMALAATDMRLVDRRTASATARAKSLCDSTMRGLALGVSV